MARRGCGGSDGLGPGEARADNASVSGRGNILSLRRQRQRKRPRQYPELAAAAAAAILRLVCSSRARDLWLVVHAVAHKRTFRCAKRFGCARTVKWPTMLGSSQRHAPPEALQLLLVHRQQLQRRPGPVLEEGQIDLVARVAGGQARAAELRARRREVILQRAGRG